MNISLNTNHPDYQLSFTNINDVGDDTFDCFLEVTSKWVSCKRQFFFDKYHLGLFLQNLEEINNNFNGKAVLKAQFEEQEISFKGNNLGTIFVKGFLVEYSDQDQSLHFGFVMDQTVIGELLEKFNSVI